jgi:DNA ligase-1
MQKLMKRRSDGRIQEWSIEVLADAFRVTSGEQNGKQIVNNWTYCKGKNTGKSNETTDEIQAMAEAQAKWNKKLKGEYSTSLDSVDSIGFHKAMLAKVWGDYENDIAFPLYTQPKLDGIRCIADKNGLKTRTGKEITAVPHIKESLESFFEKFPDAVLDGELYCDKFDNDFNAICSIVRKSKLTEEDKETAKIIEYHVYDTINENVFSERNKFVAQNCENINYVEVVETQLVGSKSELDDSEYTILGYKEGIGNRAGTIGHFVFETENSISFHSNVKGSREYISDLLKQGDSLIGKTATIKYFNLTPNGVPRFPYVIAIRDYE